MLTSDEFAEDLAQILRINMRAVLGGAGAERVTSVEYLGSNRIRVVTDDRGEIFDYQIICSGATMVQPEDTSPPMPTEGPPESFEGKEAEEVIDEAQPQGMGERIDRKLRPPKVSPTTKSFDKTPKRPANNDPKKTALGRKAIKKAKRHPQEGLSKFIGDALTSDRKQIAELAAHIDPILESRNIKLAIGTSDDSGKLAEIGDIVRNVWSERFIEKHIGIANSRSGELAVFDKSAKVLDEVKEWGTHLCWIERIKKPSFVIYKVCADTTPSKAFIECRNDRNRDLILSGDRANIIPKIFGD